MSSSSFLVPTASPAAAGLPRESVCLRALLFHSALLLATVGESPHWVGQQRSLWCLDRIKVLETFSGAVHGRTGRRTNSRRNPAQAFDAGIVFVDRVVLKKWRDTSPALPLRLRSATRRRSLAGAPSRSPPYRRPPLSSESLGTPLRSV